MTHLLASPTNPGMRRALDTRKETPERWSVAVQPRPAVPLPGPSECTNPTTWSWTSTTQPELPYTPASPGLAGCPRRTERRGLLGVTV
ncbi:hypothetical protein LY78DRAFT_661720 [Colletotrichum sublineola]|nr:hypothetical protein LY78DRAFT_661720 [Colletotrichum sublineola]